MDSFFHPDKTPRPGDPRINIQKDKGMAKTYQVNQVLTAAWSAPSWPAYEAITLCKFGRANDK